MAQHDMATSPHPCLPMRISAVRRALRRLRPGGQLHLYTDSAIIAGEDRMRSALDRLARETAVLCITAKSTPTCSAKNLTALYIATSNALTGVKPVA
ncbi:tRNA G46 methylase TrmB [Novosphingobium sp. SG751A]|nr:tRNA G46 methylase TrmB [Novosphingobium sp. SG751A]